MLKKFRIWWYIFVIPAFLRGNGDGISTWKLAGQITWSKQYSNKNKQDPALRKWKARTESCWLFSDLHMCILARVCI